MSTGSAHLYHTTHPSSAGEVQHCFPTELPLTSAPFLWRPKEGDTQASAKEAGNKPILSAALPLRCLPTWVGIAVGCSYHMLEQIFGCNPALVHCWCFKSMKKLHQFQLVLLESSEIYSTTYIVSTLYKGCYMCTLDHATIIINYI